MKTKTIPFLVIAAIVMSAVAVGTLVAIASPGLVVLDTVDINTDIDNNAVVCGGSCSSFKPEQAGGWGGEYGEGAVTAYPGDNDDAGYVTLDTPKGAAKAIRIRHLDGLADDSFDVSVKDVHGNYVFVGSYADQSATEKWEVTTFVLPNGETLQLDRGGTIEVKIKLTGAHWSGFDTWGQLAIDKVDLLGRGPAK